VAFQDVERELGAAEPAWLGPLRALKADVTLYAEARRLSLAILAGGRSHSARFAVWLDVLCRPDSRAVFAHDGPVQACVFVRRDLVGCKIALAVPASDLSQCTLVLDMVLQGKRLHADFTAQCALDKPLLAVLLMRRQLFHAIRSFAPFALLCAHLAHSVVRLDNVGKELGLAQSTRKLALGAESGRMLLKHRSEHGLRTQRARLQAVGALRRVALHHVKSEERMALLAHTLTLVAHELVASLLFESKLMIATGAFPWLLWALVLMQRHDKEFRHRLLAELACGRPAVAGSEMFIQLMQLALLLAVSTLDAAMSATLEMFRQSSRLHFRAAVFARARPLGA
jgi:hypothetical protein